MTSLENNKMKTVAFIPARGGSKGLPGKNIKILNGKPLITYSIEQALNSEYINEVYVSSDSSDILNISKNLGAKTVLRPNNISGDTSTTESAIDHFISETDVDADVIVLMQCTSPFRRDGCLDEAVLELKNGYDSIVSVSPTHKFRWKVIDGNIHSLYDYKNRPRRQDVEHPEFIETGSFYVFRRSNYIKERNRLCGRVGYHIMSEEYSYEIDTIHDFKIIEALMKEGP
ncbi:MAG: acylneuraminate cytidylyltransferase family protein [Candidatus Bathyarchaeota archaeon]|nr:acylneuraminate cytidylyltransferase family protein [Candidatus Bathyarchaeota archaeon]